MTERADCELIVSFQWVDWDDDAPMPVDPTDPAQIRTAYQWAKDQYYRYEHEDFLSRHGYGYSEDDARIIRHDYEQIVLFLAAVKRQFHRMRQRDLAALEAWANGEPIREVC